jgi:hypothetical protein
LMPRSPFTICRGVMLEITLLLNCYLFAFMTWQFQLTFVKNKIKKSMADWHCYVSGMG